MQLNFNANMGFDSITAALRFETLSANGEDCCSMSLLSSLTGLETSAGRTARTLKTTVPKPSFVANRSFVFCLALITNISKSEREKESGTCTEFCKNTWGGQGCTLYGHCNFDDTNTTHENHKSNSGNKLKNKGQVREWRLVKKKKKNKARLATLILPKTWKWHFDGRSHRHPVVQIQSRHCQFHQLSKWTCLLKQKQGNYNLTLDGWFPFHFPQPSQVMDFVTFKAKENHALLSHDYDEKWNYIYSCSSIAIDYQFYIRFSTEKI